MTSRILGAPLGGTMRGAHQALDCRASFLITPPNFRSGGGSCFPLMVVVALGEPGTPVTCWAAMVEAGIARMIAMPRADADNKVIILEKFGAFMLITLLLIASQQ